MQARTTTWGQTWATVQGVFQPVAHEHAVTGSNDASGSRGMSHAVSRITCTPQMGGPLPQVLTRMWLVERKHPPATSALCWSRRYRTDPEDLASTPAGGQPVVGLAPGCGRRGLHLPRICLKGDIRDISKSVKTQVVVTDVLGVPGCGSRRELNPMKGTP